MATNKNSNKIKRGEVDRWTGNAVILSKNTPEQQKVVDEINATLQAKGKKKPTSTKKKK